MFYCSHFSKETSCSNGCVFSTFSDSSIGGSPNTLLSEGGCWWSCWCFRPSCFCFDLLVAVFNFCIWACFAYFWLLFTFLFSAVRFFYRLLLLCFGYCLGNVFEVCPVCEKNPFGVLRREFARHYKLNFQLRGYLEQLSVGLHWRCIIFIEY